MQLRIWWPISFTAAIVLLCILIFPSDLRLADLLGKAGRIDEAIRAYSLLLQKEPGRHDIRMQLARLYIEKNDFDNAVANVEQLGSDFVQNPIVLNQIVDIYSQLGDSVKTVQTLERMVTLAPENAEYRWKLAEAYEWNNERAKAQTLYEDLLNETPTDVSLLRKLVSISVAERDWVKGKLYLRRLLGQKPAELPSRKLLGDIYVESGQKELACAEYEKVLRADPTDTALRAKLADVYLWNGDYDRGIAHYEQLVQNDPLNDGRFKKLIELTQDYEPAKAIDYLKYRLSQVPADFDAQELLYELHLRVGDPKAAVDQLKSIIKMRPDEPVYMNELAQLLLNMQELELANEVWQQLLEHDEYRQNAAAHLRSYYRDYKNFEALADLYERLADNKHLVESWRSEQAYLLVRLGRYGDAIDCFDNILEDHPDDATTRVCLAELFLRTGDSGKATRLLKRGREKYHADDAKFLAYSANFFEDIAEYKEAVRSLEYLTALTDDPERYVERLVHLYVKSGDFDKARELYRQIITANPEVVDWRFKLADLEWQQGHFDEVHEQIWQIKSGIPPASEIDKHIANFYFERSFYSAAADYFDKALQMTPADSLSMQRRALSLAWSSQSEKALIAFEDYHKRFGKDYFSQYHHAILLIEAGEKAAAEKKFDSAMQFSQKSEHTRTGRSVRAGIYAYRGDYQKAGRMYRMLLSEYPEDLSIYLDFAQSLIILQRFEESEKWLTRVRKQQPDNYRALHLQAQIYFEQKKYAKASEALAGLLRYRPGDINLMMDLGESQLLDGDWPAGMKMLRHVSEIYSDYLPARRRLIELRRQHAEAFAFDYSQEEQSGGLLKKLKRFSFTKALSSILGLEAGVGEEDYSADGSALTGRKHKRLDFAINSSWNGQLETRVAAGGLHSAGKWRTTGYGAMLWRFNSFGSLNLSADINALWSDPLVAPLFDGRMQRVNGELNLTLLKNIVLWNRVSHEWHKINDDDAFGQALRTNAQVGYRWGLKPYLLTYYEIYNLSYSYENAANAAIIGIPENETVHYLGAAIQHQLTRRFYFQFGSAVGLNTRLNKAQYFSTLHLEYNLLRDLRLRANFALGNQETLTGNDDLKSFSLDFFYFYR